MLFANSNVSVLVFQVLLIILLALNRQGWLGQAMGNFQCRDILLIWITVWQGPIVFAVGADGSCLDIFSVICLFFLHLSGRWPNVD